MAVPRILIVDDNLLNIELAVCLLEHAGLQVHSVSQPAQAIGHLRAWLPDLVLMDVQMPGIDGLSLTRTIKSDPALRHLPVVAFTAYAMKGDEQRMRAAGCDGYIAKPIDVATFADTVRAHLPAVVRT